MRKTRRIYLLQNKNQVNRFIFQNLLGAEGTSLQWRLMASHLIAKLSRDLPEKPELAESSVSSTELLGELFLLLGYFALNNFDNQVSLEFGAPTFVQKFA